MAHWEKQLEMFKTTYNTTELSGELSEKMLRQPRLDLIQLDSCQPV
jgi:hypothetical protein